MLFLSTPQCFRPLHGVLSLLTSLQRKSKLYLLAISLSIFSVGFCNSQVELVSPENIESQIKISSRFPKSIESWESNRRFYFLVNLLANHGAERCDLYSQKERCNFFPFSINEERIEILSEHLNPISQKKRYLRKNLILLMGRAADNGAKEKDLLILPKLSYTTTEKDRELSELFAFLIRHGKNCRRPLKLILRQDTSVGDLTESYRTVFQNLQSICFREVEK